MNTSLRLFIQLLILSVFYWVLAFSFYVFIRFYGIDFQMSFFVDEPVDFPIEETLRSSIFVGIVLGGIYAIVEWAFDRFLSSKFALGLSIIIKSAIYFALIIFLMSIARDFVFEQIDLSDSTEREWYQNPVFWNTIIYFVVASIVFSFIRIANNKFGPGVFIKMLLGKYKKPKEEDRVLMFLDLKDSTTIAEQLGHKVYSNFIQDCFIDLNKILAKYNAQVYQYVGDEAVLSWTAKKGFKNDNCIHIYFAFEQQLKSRAKYYQEKYNVQPKFKAGVHCGTLIVAEVGTVKKEIAYHGDVINTAARIQGQCNALGASLLISETVLNKIRPVNKAKAVAKGEILLKGKESTVAIFEMPNT